MNNNYISIMGDICPTQDYSDLFLSEDCSLLFHDVLPIITNATFSLCNLECSVTERSEPIKKCGPALKMNPKSLSLLKDTGFDCVSLANNHIKDYSSESVVDTISELNNRNISWFGVGETSSKIVPIKYVKIGSKTVGFASFAEHEFNIASNDEAGANCFDPYSSFDDISTWKKDCDYLIILYHGGIEHYRYPSPLLQKKCRKMIKAGADMVLCQHSHCIGTFEEYMGRLILYGQGNGVFGYREGSIEWNRGLLVLITLENNVFSYSFRLMKACEDGVRFASEEDEMAVINEMKDLSKHLSDYQFIENDWKKFCRSNAALNRSLLYGKNRVFNKLNRFVNNRLFRLCYSTYAEMITMNLIRCDSWREVITTILEDDVYGE